MFDPLTKRIESMDEETKYPISKREYDYIKTSIQDTIPSIEAISILDKIWPVFAGFALSQLYVALSSDQNITAWSFFGLASVFGVATFLSAWKSRKVQAGNIHAVVRHMDFSEEHFREGTEARIVEDVLFADDFEEDSNWINYKSGIVIRSDDHCHNGRYSLKKDKYDDKEGGGFRILDQGIGLGISLTGWIYRPTLGPGGKADRLAIEDTNFNGYGFCVSHGNGRIWIERRDNGDPKDISLGRRIGPIINQWYYFRFDMRRDGIFELTLWDQQQSEIGKIVSVGDMSYSWFNRIVVHGGHPYYIDELKVTLLR